MATKYTLTTAFAAITETSGTIQNVGAESVELASSTNAVAGEGIVLNPGEKRSFKGALSARSLGDAGAVVNVVDFTEAGEGGEEYDLPIASATTLGGVKIGSSFTVANDGTLGIKKSGKTILGGVKSSDDEGKVTVNNDGTMTYNPPGYRQPNTTYEAGQIAYHASLPTGWYLECTTEGTTGSGDLTISSPAVGTTVTDGTVVWTVNSQSNKVKSNITSYPNNDLNNLLDNGAAAFGESTINRPPDGYVVDGMILNINKGGCVAQFGFPMRYLASQGDGVIFTRIGNGDGSYWTPWRTIEQIVAKSLGDNGYIKYASGLIMQWGSARTTLSTSENTRIGFNINFTSVPRVVAFGYNSTIKLINVYINEFYIRGVNLDATNNGYEWIAIGY